MLFKMLLFQYSFILFIFLTIKWIYILFYCNIYEYMWRRGKRQSPDEEETEAPPEPVMLRISWRLNQVNMRDTDQKTFIFH